MDRFDKAKKVGILGVVCNIFLMIIKLIAGYYCKSNAMIADGFNSVGDVFSSVMTLIGNKVASKPKDKDHPYGHGKAEYIFSLIIGIVLVYVSFSTFKSSIESLIQNNIIANAPILFIVAAITIITKLILYIYCNRICKSINNILIEAAAQDHISDVFVSIGTIIGIAGSYLGYFWFDAVVGLLISIYIAKSGIEILKISFKVLMDTAELDTSPIVIEATDIINSFSEIDHIDAITARPVGNRFALVIKISVPGNMTVLNSHHVTKKIKERIMHNPDISDVTIHVNPMEEHIGPSKL